MPVTINKHQKVEVIDNREEFKTVEKQKKTWWKREQISIISEFNGIDFSTDRERVKADSIKTKSTEGLNLSIELISRPTNKVNQYLITVVMINRTTVVKGISRDECAVFQTGFEVDILSSDQTENILPYPQSLNENFLEEEKSIELLYRHAKTYAVGHGCSADWVKEHNTSERAEKVIATHFPVYELPNVTSDIRLEDGSELKISMAKLAGLVKGDNGFADLEMMLEQYEKWILTQEKISKQLKPNFQETSEKHLIGCRNRLNRMEAGLNFIKTDKKAFKSFQLANHAILIQQHRSKQSLRTPTFTGKSDVPKFTSPALDFDLAEKHEYLGYWRGFQIAFLLLAVQSAADPECSERETVELIWFPTGGGKTEAYLGLAAFSLFYRRLSDPKDSGTHIFLRYTLRLLTAQQFERAGALICAMEHLRRQNSNRLGHKEISIALWLGNDITPGSCKDAVRVLRSLKSHPHLTENKFILNRCPWCAAQLGKIETKSSGKKASSKAARIIGYEEKNKTVIFHCPDKSCEFSKKLPIYVIDEDIYKVQPSMFIATVDKFAVLAWKPEARSLFGLDKNGNRIFSPPGLTIQDELHLISGPLGTMVAHYEPIVEYLCTDFRRNKPVRPKIVCSTATTRQYKEQVRSLFAREQTELFPPPGIDIGDSFFASYARDKKGNLLPGRKYVGINAPGLGSLQNTEVRVYTSLLQASADLPSKTRDQYWTLFIFYNSLKILGNAISLFQSNIPAYFLTYQNRTRLPKLRRIKQPLELTGRLKSDEIPAVLRKLEMNSAGNLGKNAVDVCLASSIAEVGMDVSRLGLMALVGQPKSVAQYIQITGRVGRILLIPGLIVTIFSSTQPRDRSHFEYFRSFHERLYAQVEPLSVTPFSIPALERALHGVMTAFIRQTGSKRQTASPYPMPEEKLRVLKNILLKRIQIVAPEMLDDFERIFEKRINEWRKWERTNWTGDFINRNYRDALIRPYERWTDEIRGSSCWMTPISMRNVDAEAAFGITNYYQSL